MKTTLIRATASLLVAVSVLSLSACSTKQVANTTGDTLSLAGRGAVHAVAGAGKLVVNGTKAAVSRD